jgi:hypothetical protein
MTARFRIRTRQGHEVSFGSPASFEEFVRSGDLSPGDLVYDAVSGEWAPARTHPLVREIVYEMGPAGAEEASVEGPQPSESRDPSEASDAREREEESWARAGEAMKGLGALDLAPSLDSMSPDQQARAFLQRMESERATQRELGIEGDPAESVRLEGSATLADVSVGAQGVVHPAPVRTSDGTRAAREVSATTSPWQRPRREEERDDVDEKGPPSGRWARRIGWVASRLAITVFLGAAAFAGWYFGADVIRLAIAAASVDEPVPVEAPVGPEPIIAATDEAVGTRANERFLSTTQPLLAGLPSIPAVWMEPEYLVLPSDFPDLPAAWARYLDTVRSVRAGDRERYRRALERALDDAGVQEPEERAERLGRGLASFQPRAAELERHWDRAEALATAALQSHEALLGVEGVIRYDPSRATGIQSGLGRGTSGRTGEAESLLRQAVDLVEQRLASDGLGPRERANVREWVWDGVLDAMSR